MRRLSKPAVALLAMPQRVEPCLAVLKPKAPTGADWPFEIKSDGYRLAIYIESKDVRIITRGGHDGTHRFPAIAAAAKGLDVHTTILDGEAVVLEDNWRSDFGALQRSLGGRSGKMASTESVLMAFDLLYLDGHDPTGSELSLRRHLLEGLVVSAGDAAIRLSEEVEADGTQLLEHACRIGLEGIIAKRRDQPYRSSPNGIESESFMIVGHEPSAAARGGIGSLLLAGRKGHDLALRRLGRDRIQRKGRRLSSRSARQAQSEDAVYTLKGKEPRLRPGKALPVIAHRQPANETLCEEPHMSLPIRISVRERAGRCGP